MVAGRGIFSRQGQVRQCDVTGGVDRYEGVHKTCVGLTLCEFLQIYELSIFNGNRLIYNDAVIGRYVTSTTTIPNSARWQSFNDGTGVG